MKTRFFCITVFVCFVFITGITPFVESASIMQDTWKNKMSNAEEKDTLPLFAPVARPGTLLFVGDIMLARAVESRMKKSGMRYPFEALESTLSSPDATIGNFEGVVSKVHYPTPNYTFQFSVEPVYLAHLKTVGFDVLSLANNHALDYGKASLTHTRTLCEEYGLICGGDPKGLTEKSIKVVEVGTHHVGILFVHTLFGAPASNTLRASITELNQQSDIQVAYVHWGEEYELIHNDVQEELAKTLIDEGIDVVIGHHPHVVQDVELYKDKPIFYSLGNFVFDQFFSKNVQEMLGVHMKIDKAEITYTLMPFSSVDTESQPHHADEMTASGLRERILSNLGNDSHVDVTFGTITVPR
ncbi:CapA family protein [Candidatus Kaiserbacteria bacterium]|nr:MAG: CapA family protein [Candidatus Kaiserbacteria bacterium]